MKVLIFQSALFLFNVPLSAQVPGTSRATLVVIGPAKSVATLTPRFRELAAAEGVVDRGIPMIAYAEDQAETRESALRLRQLTSNAFIVRPEWCWILMQGSEVFDSGAEVPDPTTFEHLLNSRLGPTPVARLKAFLQSHPTHFEARRDLVKALLPRLRTRLGQGVPTMESPASLLSPEADHRLWGDIAEAWEILFQGWDWAMDPTGVGLEMLPSGCPEANSPLMRSLYRRNLPRVRSLLQENLNHADLWSTYLRMCMATDVPGLSSLSSAPALTKTDGDAPFMSLMVPSRVHELAIRQETWKEDFAILNWIWETRIRPSIEAGKLEEWVSPWAPKGASPTLDRRTRAQEAVWKHMLSPLLEAMVRGGQGIRVEGFLASLDPDSAEICTEARLRPLANRLGVPLWKSRPSPGAPAPRGLPSEARPHAGLRLFHQAQPVESAYREIHSALMQKGFLSEAFTSVPDPVRQALGWPPGQPHWALVDPGGRIKAQGEILPTPEDLPTVLMAHQLVPEGERLRGVLDRDPTDLDSLVTLATALQYQALALQTAHPRPAEAQIALITQVWSDYQETLDRILRHPLGTSPNTLGRLGVWATASLRTGLPGDWPAPSSPPPEGASACWLRLAPKHLAAVEDALLRRPSEMTLWLAWMSLQGGPPASLPDLLAQAETSPLAPRGPLWPGSELLAVAASTLLSQERWDPLTRLLDPRWAQACADQDRDPQTSPESKKRLAWTQELLQVQVETRLKQGDASGAAALFTEGERRFGGLSEATRSRLAGRAKSLQAPDLADQWRPRDSGAHTVHHRVGHTPAPGNSAD